MATEEQECERVILICWIFVVWRSAESFSGRSERHGRELTALPGRFAAPYIGHPTRRDRIKPALWICRHTQVGPLHGGGEQCFLNGIFRDVELPVAPDECAEHLRRALA